MRYDITFSLKSSSFFDFSVVNELLVKVQLQLTMDQRNGYLRYWKDSAVQTCRSFKYF